MSESPEKRIYIIDDDEAVLRSLRVVLGRRYRVETNANAVAAIASLLKDPVDLVISDIRMPECDGFELLQRLRQLPGLPVILYSGYQDRLEDGATQAVYQPFAYVTKGGNLRDFLELIDRALQPK